MSVKKAWSICSFAIILLSACNNNKSSATDSGVPKTTTPPPVSATPPPSPKPEIYLYVTRVDKLNLRDQSNKNGKVITQFKEGEFVEGTGEVSANKEDATLRGISWTEPYYKVVSTTPEQFTGWAYGGALQRVYSGSRTTSPDLGKLVQLSMFLTPLNVKKIESGKQAWNYVNANFADSKGTLADAAFILLERFLFRMETEGEFYKLTEKVKWTDADMQAIADQKFTMTTYPVSKTLADNGFTLDTGEGMVFPIVDWEKLSTFFVNRVTPPMKSYIQQSTTESIHTMMDDGGFSIPMEQVADRAVFWEKFNQEHLYFILHEETEESQKWMLHALTNGADNTPVFDSETKKVMPEFSQMWKYVQDKYAGTAAAKRVQEFSGFVNAAGGKVNAQVEAAQQRYNAELNEPHN